MTSHEAIILADAALSASLPPLWRIILWAAFGAALGMGIYALASPQRKLSGMKVRQKEARHKLLRYDGDWQGMRSLIMEDLSLSFRHLAYSIPPFVLSAAPAVWMMLSLSDIFGEKEFTAFGPAWMHGFEFWYILTLTVCSLAIKAIFRIG